jgi:serine/threonine-protein kinase
LKLFALYAACMTADRMIPGHHVPQFDEANLFWKSISVSLLNGGALWLFYIAIEPWVRRRWPQTIISWSRFTTKGIRDPRVGRDILYGAAFGALISILKLAQIHLHGAAAAPHMPSLEVLGGMRALLAFGFRGITDSLFDPLIALFVLFLMRVLLRREWLAAVAAIALFTAISAGASAYPLVDVPATALLNVIEVVVVLRFGVPAMIAGGIVTNYLLESPLTLDFSSWYAGIGVLPFVAAGLIAWYGFRTALAGRPLLRDEIL